MKKKVFKFVGFTDPHHTMRNPINRIDNLFDTTLRKIDEINSIMKEEEDVPSIALVAGDIFDSPDISDNVAGIIGKKYASLGRVIAIAGNHDLRGNNLSTLPQTKLGLLDKVGIIEVLKPFEKKIIDAEGVTIQITGSSSDFGIDEKQEAYIVEEKDADIAIHLVHAMLLSNTPKFGSYMPLKEIQNKTKADITMSGHFHLGFGPIFENGKLFVNPGALVRKYNFVEEIHRKPQVLIINIYDDKTFDYEMRILTSAEDGSKVLDRQKIEMKRFYDNKLKEYTQALTIEQSSAYNLDIDVVLQEIAKQDNIEDDVVKLALEGLSKARTLLNTEQ